MMRSVVKAVVAILALNASAPSSSHAQAVQPPERVSPMYPGEQIVEAAGFPALVKFEAGAPGAPLVVFITGGGVLARVAYGHREGKPSDFLGYWMKRDGIPFLAISYPMGNPVFAAAAAAVAFAPGSPTKNM